MKAFMNLIQKFPVNKSTVKWCAIVSISLILVEYSGLYLADVRKVDFWYFNYEYRGILAVVGFFLLFLGTVVPLLLTATARLLGGDMQKHADSLSFGRLFIMKNED